MFKNPLLLTFAILGVMTIISCKKDDDKTAACANNTGWLKDGHLSVFVNTPIFIPGDTLYISLEEVSPGVFKSTSKFDEGTFYPTQSNFVQACDNIIYQAASADLANKQEAYRIEGNVGDTWTTTTGSTGGNTITTVTTITEKNVSVTVPAGTFVCYKYEQVSTSSAGGSVTTNTYLNNNDGVVLVDGTSVHYELARKNF